MRTTKTKSIYIISLGCDKNRVDTEGMLFTLKNGGFCITSDIDSANIIVINTCAFLNSAREEAIDTILECAAKKSNRLEKLVVTGCFPQKYREELIEGLPEVDVFLGIDNYGNIDKIISSLYNDNISTEKTASTDSHTSRLFDPCHAQGRLLTTPAHYGYLKIADGCDNFCSYCLIPHIRGRYRSATLDKLVAEAKGLVDGGVRELILVAQDVTRFGRDNGESLPKLIQELSRIDGLEWIRLMYCYPEHITEQLVESIATNPKVVKYVDMPMQHASDKILRAMNRRGGLDSAVGAITRLRAACPDIAIRSTFITGFAGETEQDHKIVKDFLNTYKLTHAGFFAFSREEGTPAFEFPNQIEESVKQRRLAELYAIQAEVSLANNRAAIGKRMRVIYEGVDFDRQMFEGRSMYQAPEIDGKIYFKAKSVEVGNFYDIMIEDTLDSYDLKGSVVED